jgi:hypothetical protein
MKILKFEDFLFKQFDVLKRCSNKTIEEVKRVKDEKVFLRNQFLFVKTDKLIKACNGKDLEVEIIVYLLAFSEDLKQVELEVNVDLCNSDWTLEFSNSKIDINDLEEEVSKLAQEIKQKCKGKNYPYQQWDRIVSEAAENGASEKEIKEIIKNF